MKNRILCIILALLLLFTGCSTSASETEPQLTDADILAQRRDMVESYMRQMNMVFWRAENDFTYDVATGEIQIYADRIYRGLPYTGASATDVRLSDLSTKVDAHGFPIISGLDEISMGSTSSKSILGNDCSGAVWLSWSQISTSISNFKAATRQMTTSNGYLRVGEYESPDDIYTDTTLDCQVNDKETMFKAYAQLQKGDAVVYFKNTRGHAMMVVGNTVKEKDGTILGSSSYVTILDQTSSGIKADDCYYDETLKENVYCIGNVDKIYTYVDLFSQGYLPVTCKELVDPSPVETVYIQDSETNFTADTIFQGTFSSNFPIDSVKITITDSTGKTVQEAVCYNREKNRRNISLATFTTESIPIVQGAIDLSSLNPGTYHCTHICRTPYGVEHKMRDFDFTK